MDITELDILKSMDLFDTIHSGVSRELANIRWDGEQLSALKTFIHDEQ